MAESQLKPLFFLKNQTLKIQLPHLMVLVYLVSVVIIYLVLPFQEQVRDHFLISFLVGLVYLVSAVWVFAIRRNQQSALAFTLFAASVSLIVGIPTPLTTHFFLNFMWLAAQGLASGSILDLAFTFPSIDPVLKRYAHLRYAGYGIGGMLVLAALIAPHPVEAVFPHRIVDLVLIGFAILAFLFSMAWMAARRTQLLILVEQEQIRLVLISALVSLSPVCTWMVFNLIWAGSLAYSSLLLLPMIVFPVITAYVVQRYRIAYTDYILSRAVLYSLMAALVAFGYALLVSGLGLLLNWAAAPGSAWISGLAIFLVALAINPLRARLTNAVDGVFFKGQRAYAERVQTFSGELTELITIPEIFKALHQTIKSSLMPDSIQIFIYDSLSDQYCAARIEKEPASELRFSVGSAFVGALGARKAPVFLVQLEQEAPQIRQEQLRLSLLGASLFAPLRGRSRLTGWCALGERFSGDLYSPRELAFLDSLCDQAALAIERAQVVANMENRIRETTVMGRIAQGVNITISFDDMLELIYAQTVQIIPAEEYRLCLVNKESNELMETFFVQGDERLTELEKKPVAGGQILEVDVIRQRQPILAEDYSQECQRRGILPQRANLYAWMSVPLNAGAETIGALSLARTQAAATYSREQLGLLQSIADQAAGAIVKARLLQETEKRARQLSAINEVTRQLTSTLELQPLLNNILHAAVDILDCEAGSLLQVDEHTGELVFMVTAGPVAGDLVNKRLPAGTGLVGKAVKSKTPIAVNDVQQSSDWFQGPDEKTGFTTRALLVVPLIAKDNVTGVIEVINKRNGSNFNQDDLELLTAFAAQAAVAVENVRLFTHTDQALAERVEELSVMQRIDRELNASLDVKLAMQITLEWAMRQAGMPAGLVGIVQEKGVRVMASQGYSDEMQVYPEGLLPVNQYNLQQVIESGTAIRGNYTPESGAQGLLHQACSQVVLPIRRETNTIGLLLLESAACEPISDESLAFLQRLTDHAAIAIANAQLYTAVQNANLAKSEFVSFVAHELKNPMTSIKGFTELLAAGAVGTVNEAQANFLQTIRSNIERMNTLVSDLNDLSKIEAGRLRLDFSSFAASAVVDDAIRSLRRQVEEKGQKLALELPADLPPIWADRTRISQVVINLISNAHKYTGQGGEITIGAEGCENQWDESGPRQVVHIWVKDTGIGISPEDQKKIFQKFFRADDPKTREVAGTGLGLNITRALVEMQGGKIWFESVFRQGTTFHFTVPQAEK